MTEPTQEQIRLVRQMIERAEDVLRETDLCQEDADALRALLAAYEERGIERDHTEAHLMEAIGGKIGWNCRAREAEAQLAAQSEASGRLCAEAEDLLQGWDARRQLAAGCRGMGHNILTEVAGRYGSLSCWESLRRRIEEARAALSAPAQPTAEAHDQPEKNPCCGGCGGPHPFDTSIPSVLWNKVIRARGMSEYLCTTCIVKAFAEAGASFTAELFGDGFHGLPIEVRIRGEVAEAAARLCDENTAMRGTLSNIFDAARLALDKVTSVDSPQPTATAAPSEPSRGTTRDEVHYVTGTLPAADEPTPPDSPDYRPPELEAFKARGFERSNRHADEPTPSGEEE